MGGGGGSPLSCWFGCVVVGGGDESLQRAQMPSHHRTEPHSKSSQKLNPDQARVSYVPPEVDLDFQNFF